MVLESVGTGTYVIYSAANVASFVDGYFDFSVVVICVCEMVASVVAVGLSVDSL